MGFDDDFAAGVTKPQAYTYGSHGEVPTPPPAPPLPPLADGFTPPPAPPLSPVYAGGPQQPLPGGEQPFYFQWWFIALMVFIFWPVAAVLLWLSPVPTKKTKVMLTVLALVLPVLLFGCVATLGVLGTSVAGKYDNAAGVLEPSGTAAGATTLSGTVSDWALGNPDGLTAWASKEELSSLLLNMEGGSFTFYAREGVTYTMDGKSLSPAAAGEALSASVGGVTAVLADVKADETFGGVVFTSGLPMSVPRSGDNAPDGNSP